MKIYVVSLALGVLVGVIYALFGVRSPAPPVVALVGLLGILVGEQVVPIARHLIETRGVNAARAVAASRPHILGELPTRVSVQEADSEGAAGSPGVR